MGSLTSTVAAYRALAQIADPQKRRDAWVTEYEAAHPTVFERYYTKWGRKERRASAADAAPTLAPLIVEREARMQRLLGTVGNRLAPLGIHVEQPDTVLMVGGHTSNGWATYVDGKPTLFIALEFLTDGPGDDVLAVHECLHTVHMQHGHDESWPETVAAALFVEGLAVALSRRALPDLTDSLYLWFDDDHDDWVASCQDNATALRAIAADSLTSPDDAPAAKGLFSNQPLGNGLPVRSGYWLGDLMVREWGGQGMSYVDMLHLPVEVATQRVHDWLCA